MKNYSENPGHYKRLIAQIDSEVDFSGYLIAQGYQLLKKSSGSQEYRKEAERIVLQTRRNPVTYFNRNDSLDKGRFFKYLHNRSPNFYEAIKQGLDIIQRDYPEPPSVKLQQKNKRYVGLEERYRIGPLTRPNYLAEVRGLSINTLKSEAFKGRIFNAFHISDSNGRIANIALPKFDVDGKIKNYTLYNRPYRDSKDGKVKKFRLFLNGRYQYLFVSNPNINAEKIVCVESGFDAMAYHELHGRPKTFYISMSGHIDGRKLEQFLQWNHKVDPSNTLPLHLAFDQDIEGMRYDLIVLGHWINRKSKGVFIETDWKRPVMRLKLNYLSKSVVAMERDTDYINAQISSPPYGMPYGLQKPICYRDKVLWELDLEKIVLLPQHSRTYWSLAVGALSQCFAQGMLKMDKSPTTKDWNEELISIKKKSGCPPVNLC
ncbi:toprim domain-containing protein [Maribacter polysiphoniae]|uniref:Toprim domain-containing protein n=2 Tax=Flavobacteriaceae TaxID=49546 RepID=A0A316E163_9FLAO|nr:MULTISPECIES: toprim domain-containing protein [Flavobacteriaceae]MBD1260656.1 toprim domain-containing protein [Maribacter polysiphoniae]PWK24214.1 hypothetical protein LX92_01801 [Maribacter polysiphoniae]RPG33275.1 MAG: hypothetical protein CBB72_009865 [Muricauda sp. TMED12]RYC51687.1 hypothetical protein DN53_12705 [Allomuricauda olearia]|tara:strand:+ start:53604 stop:54896 length:1293 start_codon:yes stop_codon:yes gene_type:complete